MINDLGVTFGRANALNQQPRASVNLAEWAQLPIWKNSNTCIGNLSGSFTGTHAHSMAELRRAESGST